jgi:hypothetical protein
MTGWMRSTRSSGGSCVEVAFVKASHCGGGTCVEVGRDHTCDQVLMRDSKNPDGPRLVFTQVAMTAFLDGVKAGEFDRL